MAKHLSRREILGLTTTAIGGITALTTGAQAGTAEPPAQHQPGAAASHPVPERPYWEPSYSGGPADVKPLPAGRPGIDYQPVVVPTGYTLPFKIVGGVKVFHLIAEEVNHCNLKSIPMTAPMEGTTGAPPPRRHTHPPGMRCTATSPPL